MAKAVPLSKVSGLEIVECLPVEPQVKSGKSPIIRSNISIEVVKETVKNIYFPAGTRIVLPSAESSCYDLFTDGIVVYKDSFDNGLRLPLHPFIAAFMRSMRLSITEMSPNCWTHFVGFLTFCVRMNLTPEADMFWAFFRPRYDKNVFWLTSRHKGVRLSKPGRANNNNWRHGWFVVLLPPGKSSGFPPLSLGGPRMTNVPMNKLTDELEKLIEAARTMAEEEAEFMEWKYHGTKENLKYVGVDNSEGFPEADANLPEYGFTAFPPQSPKEKYASPSSAAAAAVAGLKRKRLVNQEQQSQPIGGWLSSNENDEPSPLQTEVPTPLSSEETAEESLVPALPFQQHQQEEESPNDELFIEQFVKCSSKAKALMIHKVREAEHLRIELADLQRRTSEEQDELQRVRADNSDLKTRLEAKETKLAKLKFKFEEEQAKLKFQFEEQQAMLKLQFEEQQAKLKFLFEEDKE